MNQINQSKIAFIKACWHTDIVERCQQGLIAELTEQGWPQDGVEIFEVPGAFDIPLLAKKLAELGQYDAIVAAALVVDGGIYRHDYVAATVIDALMQVQLETCVPVISAVLTPHQFHDHATHQDFFAEHFVTKGRESARACIQIVENFARISNPEAPAQVLGGAG